MKKWLTRCATAAALIGVVLQVVVSQYHPPGIWMGKPLPPGKVKPQLVNDGDSVLLLAPNGSLWTWGGTEFGFTNLFQQPVRSEMPRRMGSDSDWMNVTAIWTHTLALKTDGSLWGWGGSAQGQFGQTNVPKSDRTPARIGIETNWSQVCVGVDHSLALKIDGSLWAWGGNSNGQLGDGTTNNRFFPTMIGTERDWRTISATAFNSLAVKSNGTIWGWGRPISGKELVPTQIVPGTNWLAISTHNYGDGYVLTALKTDGTLWLNWPDAVQGYAPASVNFTQIGRDNDWTAVYTGLESFFARKRDGSWWVCGWNGYGMLGVGPNIDSLASPQRLPFSFEPWAFAPGDGSTLLLGKDGKLWSWGKRLGAQNPSALRKKFEAFVAPAVNRFPSLGFLIKSDTDLTPHLLWELPPEVRRSLGSEPKSATNNLTNF
jgi:alpha-tubulin suppressor-like RCC1 family protein